MKSVICFCFVACLGFVLTQPAKSILDLLSLNDNKDRFSTLVQAVQVAGLTDSLQKGGPFTLFAPTNDAFKKLPEGALAKLIANPDNLKKLLLMHVVNGTITASNLKAGDLTALDGSVLKVAVGDDKVVTVKGAKVTVPAAPDMNMMGSNGVIYAIDRVIMP